MNASGTTGLNWHSLAAGLMLMLEGTAYPLVFARADGRADHGLARLLFWAMSAGFVRGGVFIPRHGVWRLLFSGWACLAAVALAALSVALRAG